METRAPIQDAGLTLTIDRDRVGWLTFDQPASSVNLLSSATMERLDHVVSELESRIANGQLVALVVRSGKDGTFIAGVDVREIAALSSAREAAEASARGQRIFRRLERLGIPTIAVVDGVCVGGGTELILHCDYRVASDRDSTRIGLPEIQLGIVPGFGGTVKLPRLCGIQNALGMILTGRTATARRAARIALVDRIVGHQRLDSEVRRFVSDVLAGSVPRAAVRLSLGQRLLEGTPPGRLLLFRLARQRTAAEAGGFYPAPLRAVDLVQRTIGVSPDVAYAEEARTLGELAVTEVSRNLVRLFLLGQGARRALPGDQLRSRRPVRRAAVLGAGVMGGAIAELIAANDVPVILKDIDQSALDAGLRHSAELLRKAAARGLFSEEQSSLKFALITGSLAYDGFEDVDVAIEAVVERLPVKQQVLRELEEEVDEQAVLATNTSSLSVGQLAEVARKPERVIGLHFFNPVHRMPLVEVIRTERTSPAALARGFGFVLDLGKTPVIVADRPGFLVNRILAPYLNEAGHLVAEGIPVDRIDEALERFGMPMGPCRLLDEIGLDIALHASRELTAAFGSRMAPSPAIERLLDEGRLGRKNGRGLYLYEGGRARGPDPSVTGLVRDAAEPSATMDEGAIVRRCLYPMVNEATRTLEERIVDGADRLDLAMVMGTGFPPFRGGLLRWADRAGITTVHAGLVELNAALGDRFTPAPLLTRMAEHDLTFTDSS